MDIAKRFGRDAATYDANRRRMIPCFDDFYGTAVALAPFDRGRALRVLDLGAGTGLLSAFVAEQFPEATFTLVDVAPEMLDRAAERFAGSDRFEYVVGDYATMPFEGPYDLIVSALSIHHLDDDAKRALFRRAHAALSPDGVFINADEVLGETDAVEAMQQRAWADGARRLGAKADELDAARERMKLDRCATLTEQLRWLDDAGFSDVWCAYRSYMFAVYSGRR